MQRADVTWLLIQNKKAEEEKERKRRQKKQKQKQSLMFHWLQLLVVLMLKCSKLVVLQKAEQKPVIH